MRTGSRVAHLVVSQTVLVSQFVNAAIHVHVSGGTESFQCAQGFNAADCVCTIIRVRTVRLIQSPTRCTHCLHSLMVPPRQLGCSVQEPVSITAFATAAMHSVEREKEPIETVCSA